MLLAVVTAVGPRWHCRQHSCDICPGCHPGVQEHLVDVHIYATKGAFAALKGDGSVVTWGESSSGGYSYCVRGQLHDGVQSIAATSAAFAVLKTDGSVVTWGQERYGGDSSWVRNQLSGDIVLVVSNWSAFAALKNDGSVVTWGSFTFEDFGNPIEDYWERSPRTTSVAALW